VAQSQIKILSIISGSIVVAFEVGPSSSGIMISAGKITAAFSKAGVSIAGTQTTSAATIISSPKKQSTLNVDGGITPPVVDKGGGSGATTILVLVVVLGESFHYSCHVDTFQIIRLLA
jgi:hypothetical protein